MMFELGELVQVRRVTIDSGSWDSDRLDEPVRCNTEWVDARVCYLDAQWVGVVFDDDTHRMYRYDTKDVQAT